MLLVVGVFRVVVVPGDVEVVVPGDGSPGGSSSHPSSCRPGSQQDGLAQETGLEGQEPGGEGEGGGPQTERQT